MDSLSSRSMLLPSRYLAVTHHVSHSRRNVALSNGANQRQPTDQLGHVRKGFWALLALTIVAAFALPISVYYTTTTTSLVAHLCLWPTVPAVDTPTRLIILLAPGRDSADTQGPWAQASAQWDMLSMEMGQQRAAVSGADASYGIFVLPLSLQMVGSWRATVRLQTPGRPLWQQSIQFDARPQATRSSHAAIPSLQALLSYCQSRQHATVSSALAAGATLYACDARAWPERGGGV